MSRENLEIVRRRRRDSRNALIFGTSTGRKESASNVRNRLLARVVERANERLTQQGTDPLPNRLTPHSLRRTFASLLVALGEDPAYVMAQLGHTDAKFTLSVYARMMHRRDGERERLRRMVHGPEGQWEGNGSLRADLALVEGAEATH